MNELDNFLLRARNYCASQEHCTSDLREKLREWKCPQDKHDEVIAILVKEGFLNDERFTRAYASGKFRINHWGKTKIRYELEQRKIPADVISAGLLEIDEEEYEKALEDLLMKKNREVVEKEPFKRKQKLIAYAVQKGFEYETIKRVMKESGKF